MNTVAAEMPAFVWLRFDNGRVMLVRSLDGAFDTIVRVGSPSEDDEAFLDQIAEAVTGSEAGIENFSWRRLENGLMRVSGTITDWPNVGEDNDALTCELVEPTQEGFAAELAASILADEGSARHAIAALSGGYGINGGYGAESTIATMDGREIRCPAYPAECDYVRIAAPGIVPHEIAYWNSDEWAEAPTEVMGAILGAARGKAVG